MKLDTFVYCCDASFTDAEIKDIISDVLTHHSFGYYQRPIFEYFTHDSDNAITLHFHFDASRSFFYGDMTDSRKFRVKNLSSFTMTIHKFRGFDSAFNDIVKARNDSALWSTVVYHISIYTDATVVIKANRKKLPFNLLPTTDTDFKDALEWIRNYGYPKEF